MVLVALLLSVCLFAGGKKEGEAATTARKPVVGILVWDFSNQYVTYIRNAIRFYNNDRVELLLVDSQADQTKQNEQVDTLLQRGVDALLVSMVQTTAAPTIIEKVMPRGIPLIFFNQAPTMEDIMLYDKAYYSGSDPYDGGVRQGEMAVEAVKANPAVDKNGDGRIQYFILKGMNGHPDAEQCTQGNIDFLGKQTNPAFEAVDVQSGAWATAPAKDITDAWIGRYGERIEMLMSNNDGMMLGAYEALKGNGWFGSDPRKQALIIGHDAIPETQPLIKDGTFYGAILQNPVDGGRAAIEMALNLINGGPVTDNLGLELGEMKDYRAPFIKITKANLEVAEDIYEKALGN